MIERLYLTSAVDISPRLKAAAPTNSTTAPWMRICGSTFLHDGIKSEADAAIVESIIYIAAKLGLEVTGEGIETSEHACWLYKYGCLVGQGYHLCRPCNAEAFRDFWDRALEGPVSYHRSESQCVKL